MGLGYNVEIIWNELIDAFASGEGDRVYFLDRITGEVFFVPTAVDDEELWQQVETNPDRFLEIPRYDHSNERQIMTGFIGAVKDAELKKLLSGALAGRPPYGNINDILSFFPEELDRLTELRDEFVSSRVKVWLEEHNLYTVETTSLFSPRS